MLRVSLDRAVENLRKGAGAVQVNVQADPTEGFFSHVFHFVSLSVGSVVFE
jgi:hypothetical protein